MTADPEPGELAVVMVDASGDVVVWDANAERWFGHGRDAVLGRPIDSLVPEEYRTAHRQGLERVMSGGECRLEGAATHLPVRHADGDIVSHPARFHHLRDPHGCPIGAVAVFGPPTPDHPPWSPIPDTPR